MSRLSKIFSGVVLVLFLLSMASAQVGSGVISGQVVAPPPPTGTGGPVAFAQVRVCPYSLGAGVPCSSLALLFSDPGLTTPVANPFTTDQFGNYSFFVASGNYGLSGNYIVQITAGLGVVYSYFVGVPAGNTSVVDIRKFYSGTSAGGLTNDIGVAMQNVFSTYGPGVNLDICGLTQVVGGGPVTAYSKVDPFAGLSSKFTALILARCNVTVYISATWHFPSSGGVVLWGAPAPVVNGAVANSNGFRIYPCPLIAGCGPGNAFPQFPNDLTHPVSGTAVAIGHNSRNILPTQVKSTNPTAASTCNGTTDTCAQFTSGSPTVVCALTDAQGGCGWDITDVGGWMMPAATQVTFGAGDLAYTAQAGTACFKYITTFTSGGGGSGHDTLTLSQNIDGANDNCAIPSPGTFNNEWLIAKPNANVLLWLGFNTYTTDCFGTVIQDVNIDLIGLPRGIAMYSNNCQEGTDIIRGNWELNGNQIGISGVTRWADDDPYAGLVFDNSFTESGTAGATHYRVHYLRIGVTNVQVSGTSDGFLFNCWALADSKSKAGISEADFDTITGSNSTHRLHNAGTVDGCASGKLTLEHTEWTLNAGVELGPNFQTAVSIDYINSVNLPGASSIVQLDAAGATFGNCIWDFSTNVSGIKAINDLFNNYVLTTNGNKLSQNSSFPYCQTGLQGSTGIFTAGNTVRMLADITGITGNSPANGTVIMTIPTLPLAYNFNATCHINYQLTGGTTVGFAFKHALFGPTYFLMTGRVYTSTGQPSAVATGQNSVTAPGTVATSVMTVTPALTNTTYLSDFEIHDEFPGTGQANLQIIVYQTGGSTVSALHGSYCSIHP